MTYPSKSRGGPHTIHFHEEQRFTQWWLWAIVLASCVLPLFLLWHNLYQQLMRQSSPKSDDKELLTSLLSTVLVFGTVYLLRQMRLETTVHEDGLSLRFFPFLKRKVLWNDLNSFHARTYNPLREYGGWGLRWGRSGKALNVSGNRGLQLELKSGERLLIGSQRAEELEQAVRKAQSQSTLM